MKNIVIENNEIHKDCVIGVLKVFEDDKEIFKCYTLQEDKEGLEKGKDLRIPAGVYSLKRHPGSRFEKTLREITKYPQDKMINVYNELVPYERHILIHWGNTDKDTEGCILLGKTKGINSIGQSRIACKEFYDIFREDTLESVTLEVKNNF